MARLRHQSPPCAVLPMYLRRHRPRPTDRERRSATCPALPAGLPTAAAAGASLGLAAVLKLCGTGRVLGISGTIRGAVFSKPELWRFAFLTGMASGALWAHRALGAAAFLPLPATYSYVVRAAPLLCIACAGFLSVPPHMDTTHFTLSVRLPVVSSWASERRWGMAARLGTASVATRACPRGAWPTPSPPWPLGASQLLR